MVWYWLVRWQGVLQERVMSVAVLSTWLLLLIHLVLNKLYTTIKNVLMNCEILLTVDSEWHWKFSNISTHWILKTRKLLKRFLISVVASYLTKIEHEIRPNLEVVKELLIGCVVLITIMFNLRQAGKTKFGFQSRRGNLIVNLNWFIILRSPRSHHWPVPNPNQEILGLAKPLVNKPNRSQQRK